MFLDWVQSVWDSDFTDADPFPIATQEDIYSDDDHCASLGAFKKALTSWMDIPIEETGVYGTFWRVDFSLVAIIIDHVITATPK